MSLQVFQAHLHNIEIQETVEAGILPDEVIFGHQITNSFRSAAQGSNVGNIRKKCKKMQKNSIWNSRNMILFEFLHFFLQSVQSLVHRREQVLYFWHGAFLPVLDEVLLHFFDIADQTVRILQSLGSGGF